MSWEQDSIYKYPCPCGEGEYSVTSSSDDWGRFRNEYCMLCLKCKEKYTYSHKTVDYRPGRERERGWVLNSDLLYEENKVKEIFCKASEQCRSIWETKFNTLPSKKSKWSLLTQQGKHHPALGTFYSHTRGYREEQITEYINRYFSFYNIHRIYEVCGLDIDYVFLNTDENELSKLLRFY